MNINNNIIIMVSAIYIAMIGISNAAPPPKDPVVVVTGDTPLQVTITNESMTPVPVVYSNGSARCVIENANSWCRAAILEPSSFPSGTNTFVMQQISVIQKSRNQVERFQLNIAASYRGERYTHWLPIEQGVISFVDLLSTRIHTEPVTIYHNGEGIDNITGLAAQVYFRQAEVSQVVGDGVEQIMYYSGYYTWTAPLMFDPNL